MKKHQKHTALTRRKNGNYAPTELAILGTSCGVIEALTTQITNHLPTYRCSYLDASHATNVAKISVATHVFHKEGTVQVTAKQALNPYAQRIQFAGDDCVFINGNHYQGTTQILVLDAEKEASLQKRITQVDNVLFVVKKTGDTPFPAFLTAAHPAITSLACYAIHEAEKISNHIEKHLQEREPPLNGLVLVGGKSTRMGQDKSALEYHGKPQKHSAKELLEAQQIPTYFSVQTATGNSDEISDTFLNLGPFGGICSAFQKEPNTAWFVLPTDVPFVSKELVSLLLSKRNPSKTATVVQGKDSEFLEPLIAIYEPKAYPLLLQYLAQGYACPRKMLLNTEVEIIKVDNDLIRNINTPEAFTAAKKEIQGA